MNKVEQSEENFHEYNYDTRFRHITIALYICLKVLKTWQESAQMVLEFLKK